MDGERERERTYVVLLLRYLGGLEVVGVEGVADLERLGVLGEALEELVVDLLVDVDARARTAALAVVEAARASRQHGAGEEAGKRGGDVLDTERGPLDGLVNVGVVEDD